MNLPAFTLYERLGCRAGITRITQQLFRNHLANPLVRTRYEKSEDLARVERRAVEFFCAGTGGTESYSGLDMLATHRGMNISEQEFVAVLDDALDALEKCGIASQDMVLCAGPGYLESRGTPRRVDQLAAHHPILFRMPTNGRDRPWQLKEGGKVTFCIRRRGCGSTVVRP